MWLSDFLYSKGNSLGTKLINISKEYPSAFSPPIPFVNEIEGMFNLYFVGIAGVRLSIISSLFPLSNIFSSSNR